jgi:hypothetical protein
MNYKYKIGDIVQFKHWISKDTLLRKNDLIIENGIIIEKSNKLEHDWIVKGFNTNEPIHLKESWITKLN